MKNSYKTSKLVTSTFFLNEKLQLSNFSKIHENLVTGKRVLFEFEKNLAIPKRVLSEN